MNIDVNSLDAFFYGTVAQYHFTQHDHIRQSASTQSYAEPQADVGVRSHYLGCFKLVSYPGRRTNLSAIHDLKLPIKLRKKGRRQPHLQHGFRFLN